MRGNTGMAGFKSGFLDARASIWRLTKCCGLLEDRVKIGFANSFCMAAVFLRSFMKCNDLKQLRKVKGEEP